MSHLRFLSILLLLVFLVACGDDEGTAPPIDPTPTDTSMVDTTMVIEPPCFLLFDENGAPIGTFGVCPQEAIDEQWSDIELTGEELEYFSFLENNPASEAGTSVIDAFAVYPNPIGNGRVVNVQLITGSHALVKMKFAFVDEAGVAVHQIAATVPADSPISLAIPEDTMPYGQVYKLYFQILGNEDSEVLFQGFGNLLLCNAWPVTDYETQCL